MKGQRLGKRIIKYNKNNYNAFINHFKETNTPFTFVFYIIKLIKTQQDLFQRTGSKLAECVCYYTRLQQLKFLTKHAKGFREVNKFSVNYKWIV